MKYLQSMYAYGITPADAHPADYLSIVDCINVRQLKEKVTAAICFLLKCLRDLMKYVSSLISHLRSVLAEWKQIEEYITSVLSV